MLLAATIQCMKTGQHSIRAAEVVPGTSKDENLGSTSKLETVYSNIDCMSGQPSVKAGEVVAGTSKDEILGRTSRPGKGL